MNRELILWGRHPAHGMVWLKLSIYISQAAKVARCREGWECVVLAKGVAP